MAIFEKKDPIPGVEDEEPPERHSVAVSQSTIDYFQGKNQSWWTEPKWWSLKMIMRPGFNLFHQTRLWVTYLLRWLAQNIDSNFNVSQLTFMVVALLFIQTIFVLICTFILWGTVSPSLAMALKLLKELNERSDLYCAVEK